MLGVEENNDSYHSWIDPFRTRQGRIYKGIASHSNSLSFYWISENTLTYNKTIGKHNFSALAGFVSSKINSESSGITGKNFGSSAVHTVNAATEISATYSVPRKKKNESYLGRINYSYDDRYLLTANIRADGSSVFGPNYKWGYFPSFSAGWRISQEAFWKQNNVVSDLKLRAGWGIVGNDQIDDYASWGVVSPSSNYVISGVQVPGTALTQMENNDLRWEKTMQTNLGLDVSFLKNRIVLTADYYMKKTTDMTAAIKAYPELSCDGKSGFITDYSYPVCPCNEDTYNFIYRIWDEILPLFPSKYVHIGADEVVKAAWGTSADCENFMKQNGIKDTTALQSFFVKKLQTYLESKGKTVIAWDDVTVEPNHVE